MSIQQLLDTYGSNEYVAHSTIDVHLEQCTDLNSAYTKNVELMARLNAENQILAEEMARALQEIKKSEKRVKYQFDLLKSDVQSFDTRQDETTASIKSKLAGALATEPVQQLKQLGDRKKRILEVQKLLEQASKLEGPPTGDMETVFKGINR